MKMTGRKSEFLSTENRENRFEDYPKVSEYITVVKIIQVILKTFEHLVHGIRITVVDSSIRCNSRTHKIYVTVVICLAVYLIDKILAFGTWSDKRHITFEDIP